MPDLSSSFAFWRATAINATEKKDYHAAAAALHNINSMLTEDYLVTVDNAKYTETTTESITYECRSCHKTSSYSDIKICDITLSAFDSDVTGRKTSKQWFCKHCKKWTPQNQTEMVKSQHATPYYTGVVSTCPIDHHNMLDRRTYHPKFTKWFYNFLEELQHKLALYRIEYIAQNGEDMKDDEKYKGDVNDLSN